MDRIFKLGREKSEDAVAFTVFDVELLLLRLKPVGDDDRPYFTEEQMDLQELCRKNTITEYGGEWEQ